MKMNIRPLDGITVVSLEHAIAAPFCTRQLADLGARVIKVERPGAGDFARRYSSCRPRTRPGAPFSPTLVRKTLTIRVFRHVTLLSDRLVAL